MDTIGKFGRCCKTLNLNHEGHEEHKGDLKNILTFVCLRALRGNLGNII
jgi:hypothetical protein